MQVCRRNSRLESRAPVGRARRRRPPRCGWSARCVPSWAPSMGRCHVEICSGAVDCGAMAMDQRWGVGISGGSVERGNRTPDREALSYFGSPLGRAEPMPSWSKVRPDAAKGRQEPLGMPHRCKAFHRPFALSGALMRVLGAIVAIPRLPVGHRPHELAVSSPVAGQFVGHQHARHIPQAWSNLRKNRLETACCGGVSPRRHRDVQDVAVLIDATPQVTGDGVDLHEHLVKVPLVAGGGAGAAGWRSLPELGASAPDRLMTHYDTTYKHQLLDRTKAQREPKVQPRSG